MGLRRAEGEISVPVLGILTWTMALRLLSCLNSDPILHGGLANSETMEGAEIAFLAMLMLFVGLQSESHY